MLEQIGYTSDEFLKLSYWDITPEKHKNDEAIQLKSLEQTGQYGPYEKEYIRKDGSHFPVLLKGMIIHDSSGNKMIWSFIEDISKRNLAEKSLQRSQKMEAVGQLTGGIAQMRVEFAITGISDDDRAVLGGLRGGDEIGAGHGRSGNQQGYHKKANQ